MNQILAIENSPSINFRLEDAVEFTQKKTQDVSYELSNTQRPTSTHHKLVWDDQMNKVQVKKLNGFKSGSKLPITAQLPTMALNQKLKTEQFFEEFDKHFKVEFKSPSKTNNNEQENRIDRPLLQIFEEQEQMLMQQSNKFKDSVIRVSSNKLSPINQQAMIKTVRFRRPIKLQKITATKLKESQQELQKKMNLIQQPLRSLQQHKDNLPQRILLGECSGSPKTPVFSQPISLNKKNRTLVSLEHTKKLKIDPINHNNNNIFKIPFNEIQRLNPDNRHPLFINPNPKKLVYDVQNPQNFFLVSGTTKIQKKLYRTKARNISNPISKRIQNCTNKKRQIN